MTKQMVKQTIAQLYRNQGKNSWVSTYDEYDWEQLIKQEPVIDTDFNEWLDSEYLLEDTDRSYMRCN